MAVILTGEGHALPGVGMYAGDRDLLAARQGEVAVLVALVVAETLEAAERAAELVDAEYEALPAI